MLCKMVNSLIIIILCLTYGNFADGNDCTDTNTFGRQFVFVFPMLFPEPINEGGNLSLYTLVTNQNTNVNYITFTLSTNQSLAQLTLNSFTSIKIEFNDSYGKLLTSKNASNIIYVRSSSPISLICGILYENRGDSFLVLPMNVLSTYYRLTTGFKSRHGKMSNLYVVIPLPVDNINNTVSLPNCDNTINVQNVSYPNAYMLTCSQDLTGSTITSGYRVAVMVGVMFNSEHKTFGTEMLIPVENWGTLFSLIDFFPEDNEISVFRLVADSNSTTIISDGNKIYYLESGDSLIIAVSNITLINASNPVSVFQVRKNPLAKSLFVQIPSFEQYIQCQMSFAIVVSESQENFAYMFNLYDSIFHTVCIQGDRVSQSCYNPDFQVRSWIQDDNENIFNLKFANTANETQQIFSRGKSFYSLLQYGEINDTVVYGHIAILLLKSISYTRNILQTQEEIVKKCQCLQKPSSTIVTTTSISVQTSDVKTSNYFTTSSWSETTHNYDIHAILEQLAETPVNNSDQVTAVLIELNVTLTSANGTLNSEELKYVAETMCHCSEVDNLDDVDFYLYMDCHNNVLNQQSEEISLSQLQYNSSAKFLSCLQLLAIHLTNFSFNYSNNNVAMTIQETDCNIGLQNTNLCICIMQYLNNTINLYNNTVQAQSELGVPISAFSCLPYSVICTGQDKQFIRSDFVIYRNQYFFATLISNYSTNQDDEEDSCEITQIPQTPYTITVHVLSNTKNYRNLSQPVSYGVKLDTTPNLLHSKLVCGYWILNWYSDGCSLNGVQDGVHFCQCSHLTDFSLLVDGISKDPTLCDPVLSIIGTVITTISTICLLITILLSFARKRQLRRLDISLLNRLFQNDKPFKSVIGDMLLIVLFLFYLFFLLLADKGVPFNLSKNSCDSAGAVIYTFLVSTLFYAGFAGVAILKVYYIVFENKLMNFLTSDWFVSLISLSAPVLLTLILWFSIPNFFQRNDSFCWIRPDYIGMAVILPTSIILLGDIVVTLLLIKGFFCSGSRALQSAKGKRNIFVKKIILLITVQIILGFPWVIEYFTLGSPTVTVFHYLFTITNASQGVWLAIIYMYSFCQSISKKKSVIHRKGMQETKETILGGSRRLGGRLGRENSSNKNDINNTEEIFVNKKSNKWEITPGDEKLNNSFYSHINKSF